MMFPIGVHHSLYIPTTFIQHSDFSRSSSTLILSSSLPFPFFFSFFFCFSLFFFLFFETGHLMVCEIISYCGFDLVSRWLLNLSPFHMFVGHLCISSGNMSIQHFADFKSWIVHFLLSSYTNSLSIFNIFNLLLDIWFANIFSYSVGCLFTFLLHKSFYI